VHCPPKCSFLFVLCILHIISLHLFLVSVRAAYLDVDMLNINTFEINVSLPPQHQQVVQLIGLLYYCIILFTFPLGENIQMNIVSICLCRGG
jgi:hypothetical protein